jgi:hypothetical protein
MGLIYTAKIYCITNQSVNKTVRFEYPYTSTQNILQERLDYFMGTAMQRQVGRAAVLDSLTPVVTELSTEQKVDLLFLCVLFGYKRGTKIGHMEQLPRVPSPRSQNDRNF